VDALLGEPGHGYRDRPGFIGTSASDHTLEGNSLPWPQTTAGALLKFTAPWWEQLPGIKRKKMPNRGPFRVNRRPRRQDDNLVTHSPIQRNDQPNNPIGPAPNILNLEPLIALATDLQPAGPGRKVDKDHSSVATGDPGPCIRQNRTRRLDINTTERRNAVFPDINLDRAPVRCTEDR
jgi:hypothetical protein